ncbi:MAG TPA: restriction endonuclease [Pyrinomonadaceae bacterium]|nr:restriction endonuclease [Pyrinomonadaceae bacterium]
MSKLPAIFRVDDLYSSEVIQSALRVGNAGGVRASVADNNAVSKVVVMTSILGNKQLKENPYHDRIEGDVLVYTGAGREGDQSLSGVNKRLPQQITLEFPIYAFEIIGSRRDKSLGPKRWKFLGLLEYLRHYPSTQLDTQGQLRQVWLFEFRIHRELSEIPVEDDFAISRLALAAARVKETADAADREVVTTDLSENDLVRQKERAIRIEAVRGRLLGVPPQRFEHLIKELLLRTGFERVDVTKYSQDGGVDVNAFAGEQMWPIENLLVQVQAKRWLHSVGRRDVAELRGSLEPFARGVVVTTSYFSRAAISEANGSGKNPITLVDGYRLASIVEATNLEMA